MCLSAVARSNKLCIDVTITIDQLVDVQRSAVVRCADFCSVVSRMLNSNLKQKPQHEIVLSAVLIKIVKLAKQRRNRLIFEYATTVLLNCGLYDHF